MEMRCRSVWFPGSPINVLVRLQGFQRPEQLCLLPSSWVPTRFFHDPPAPIVPHAMLTRDRTQIRAARTVLTAASCRVRTGDVVHSGSRRLGAVPRHLQRVGKDLSNVRAHVHSTIARRSQRPPAVVVFVCVLASTYGRGNLSTPPLGGRKGLRSSCDGVVYIYIHACTLQGSSWNGS